MGQEGGSIHCGNCSRVIEPLEKIFLCHLGADTNEICAECHLVLGEGQHKIRVSWPRKGIGVLLVVYGTIQTVYALILYPLLFGSVVIDGYEIAYPGVQQGQLIGCIFGIVMAAVGAIILAIPIMPIGLLEAEIKRRGRKLWWGWFWLSIVAVMAISGLCAAIGAMREQMNP